MQNAARPFRPWARIAAAPIAALAACFGLAAGGQAPAQPETTVTIDYGLSLVGIPIGAAQLNAALVKDGYKLDLTARLTGLAGTVTGIKGAGNSAGAMAGGKLLPASYTLVTGAASHTVSVRMALNAGTVVALAVDPPIDEKADRVPLQEQHKRGVVDPLSAMVFPVDGATALLAPSACERTIPVFDGAGRFDLTLSFKELRQAALPGYAGPALTCAARYTPIAGHRTGRKSTQFMADNRDLEVTLVPVEGQRILVPLRISIRTMIGTAVIEATRMTVPRAAAVPTAAGD